MTFIEFIRKQSERTKSYEAEFARSLLTFVNQHGAPSQDEINLALRILATKNRVALMLPVMIYAREHGQFDVNYKNPEDNNKTLLMYAMIARNEKVAEFLLKHEANKELVDDTGKTALWYGTHPLKNSIRMPVYILKRNLRMFGKKIPNNLKDRDSGKVAIKAVAPAWMDDDKHEVKHRDKKIKIANDDDDDLTLIEFVEKRKTLSRNKELSDPPSHGAVKKIVKLNYTKPISQLRLIEMIKAREKNNDFQNRFPTHLKTYYRRSNDKLVSKAILLLAMKNKVTCIRDLLMAFPNANIFKIYLNEKSALDYLDDNPYVKDSSGFTAVINKLTERFDKNSNNQMTLEEIKDEDDDLEEDESLDEDSDNDSEGEDDLEEEQKLIIQPMTLFDTLPSDQAQIEKSVENDWLAKEIAPQIPDDLLLGNKSEKLPSLFPELETLQLIPQSQALPHQPVSVKFPSVKPAPPDLTFLEAVAQNDIKSVKDHIKSGVDINQVDKHTGRTALHIAVLAAAPDIVTLLLKNNIIHTAVDYDMKTALGLANAVLSERNKRQPEHNSIYRKIQDKLLGHLVNNPVRVAPLPAEHVTKMFLSLHQAGKLNPPPSLTDPSQNNTASTQNKI